MSRGARIGIIVIVVIVGFLVATLVVAPRLVQIDSYRPDVVSLLEEKTGRQVEIGHLGLVLFPRVAIRADNVAVANPAGFPAGNWLTVKQLNAQLDLGALWDRRIVLRALRLDRPALSLISNGQGQWNFQASGSPVDSRAAYPDRAAAEGNVILSEHSERRIPAFVMPSEIRGFFRFASLSVRMTSSKVLVKKRTYDLAMQTPDLPLFSLEGITKVVLKDGALSAKSLAPGQTATSVVCKGISGDLDNINLAVLSGPSPKLPDIPNATGDLSVAMLSVGAVQAAHVSSNVEASLAGIQLNNLHFSFYGGKGTGSARLDLTGADPQFQAQARLTDVNVQKLLEAFPAWRGELTGQLDTNLSISGDVKASSDPWAGKQGEGTITIRNGRLPKLTLNKSLLDLAHLAQLGAAQGDLSAFSSISLDWQLADGVISSRSIHIIGTGITVDGSGSAGLTGPGSLHYQGVAEIEARKNALSDVLAGLVDSKLKNGQIDLPFALEGTLSKPAFRLNPHSQLSAPALAARPKQGGQLHRGLFDPLQRKKSQSN